MKNAEQQNPRIDPELLKKKDAILKLRTKIKEQGRKGKRNFEPVWFRNILLIVGEQWINFDKTRRVWAKADFDDWIPRPITNRIFEASRLLKSLLIQEEPTATVRPQTDSEESIAAAQVGQEFLEVIEEECGKADADNIAASWNVATGNCFFTQYYYTDPSFGKVFIGMERCQQCGEDYGPDEVKGDTCPCGGALGKAIDEHGNEIGMEFPKGRIKEEACSPFELFFDTNVQNFDDVREIVRCKRVPKEDLERMYPQIKGKLKKNDDSNSENGGGLSEFYQKALSNLNGQIYGSVDENTPSLDYMTVMPNEDFPEGLLATIIGDEIVELTELHYKYTDSDGTERHFMNYVHAGCDVVPGRFWRKTPIDDLAQKQFQRNKNESLLETQLMTMAGGKWLEPDGANMDAPTGIPAQRLKYTYQPNVPEPKMVNGIPPPPVMIQRIEQIDAEMERILGSNDVLKGNLPAGLDTFSGLRLLSERSYSIHNAMMRSREVAKQKRVRNYLAIAKTFFTESRRKTIENENGNWEMKEFSKSDLMGGVDIKVEAGSGMPRSKAVENAAIIDSIKVGLINPQDPKVNFKILQKLDQSDLAPSLSNDIKDAAREWHDFKDAVMGNPQDPSKWVARPRFGIDNEQIHMQDALSRAKESEFFELPPAAQQKWVEHANYHRTNMEAEAQKQAMMGAQQPEAGPTAEPTAA